LYIYIINNYNNYNKLFQFNNNPYNRLFIYYIFLLFNLYIMNRWQKKDYE
jgi:hypothetical protein